jgi:hypothetical protein
MTLARPLSRPLIFGKSVHPIPPSVPLLPDVERRLNLGAIGDSTALRGYVRRARTVAGLSLAGALVTTYLAFQFPSLWTATIVLLAGAAFDWGRGRLGAAVQLHGPDLLIVQGPLAGTKLGPDSVVLIGFGAPGRPGRRAPETFWRGDVDSPGASHIVAMRLRPARGLPKALIVPEQSVEAARRSVQLLRSWHASHT